ncbi:MAG: Uncharacterized protein G01um101477_281 [Candidatus Doudnabacteria bacterium Gr01-1014_77]|uniref:YdbS-like PH domain-containing protein n=1 Tax=Candidatus Doudnabacteria bacterium Gr01-1014_77 TaxID=2017133 RepID=A0A554JC44_9BACT|nr:MAG: Uncharacterized protein G01um101477_281 [Candidatus Doudnabacteria bacterium Gr01-1014_77]
MFSHQLHNDEQLLAVYRKHEITLVPKVLQIFILIFIPWFFGLKYDFIFSTTGHAQIFIGWTLLVAMFALHAFVIWSVNVYIVTSKRLLHIVHTGLFKKTVVETPLDRILNVSFRTTGISSTLFHYGDVLVEVVGLDHSLILKAIPNPSKVKDYIWKVHLEYGAKSSTKTAYTQPEFAKVFIKPKRSI